MPLNFLHSFCFNAKLEEADTGMLMRSRQWLGWVFLLPVPKVLPDCCGNEWRTAAWDRYYSSGDGNYANSAYLESLDPRISHCYNFFIQVCTT